MSRTRPNTPTVPRFRLLATALAAMAMLASPAPGQPSPCTNGCETMVSQLGLSCVGGLANENGIEKPTTSYFAHGCAAYPTSGWGFNVDHALHFSVTSPIDITHVCIGVSGAALAMVQIPSAALRVHLFYGPPTQPTGMPFVTATTWTRNGNRILVPVGSQTITGDFWVVVTYFDVPPQQQRQFVAARTGGKAMLRVSGVGVGSCGGLLPGTWWEYDDVANLAYSWDYYGAAPIIRPIRLASSPSGTAAFLATPSGGLTTSESGVTATFSLRLSEPPGISTIVRVTTGDSTEGRLRDSSGNLVDSQAFIFTNSNYSLPRPVQVVGMDDAAVDGDQSYTLNVTRDQGSPQYAGVTAQVAVLNRDNDNSSAVPQRHWSSIPASGPAARRLYAMAYDEARQELVLFGGRNAVGTTFGDTWAYKNNQWTLKATGGPLPRVSPAMAYDSTVQKIVLFGGYPLFGPAYNDTWEWNGQSWAPQATLDPVLPGPRGEHAMAYDAGRQRMVLHGGRNGATGSVYQDTYELVRPPAAQYVDWQQRSSSSDAGQRTGHGMAYDPDLGLTFLFGGYFGGGQGQVQGTYAWNGAAWTWVTNAGPLGRIQHAMAFDKLRRRTVIQGGFDGGFMFSDTWEFDGAGWTSLPQASGPFRAMHRMVSSASELLIFGGVNTANGDHNDLWSLNGSAVTRYYHIAGAGSGTAFQLGVTGSGWGTLTPPLVAPPGSSAATIGSIMAGALSALPGVVGVTPVPGAPHVIGISYAGHASMLSGVSAAQPPLSVIQPSPPVSINPVIQEVYLTGSDCNENGMDDTIDLLDDPSLDANGNGAMDSCEPPPPPPPCPGDLDGDLIVGITDMLDVLAAWGECGKCPADLDGDGNVAIGDLLGVLAAWGGCDGDGDA